MTNERIRAVKEMYPSCDRDWDADMADKAFYPLMDTLLGLSERYPMVVQAVEKQVEEQAPTIPKQKKRDLTIKVAMEVTAPNDIDLAKRLTPQQRRVLQLVADGDTNKEIGKKLWLSDLTIKSHMVGIKRKLCLKSANKAQMVAIGIRAGVIK